MPLERRQTLNYTKSIAYIYKIICDLQSKKESKNFKYSVKFFIS